MMQETSVGWDPQTICYRNPGWAIRIYALFLIVVVCYAGIRTVLLAYNLRYRWLRISRMQGEPSIDTIARAALIGEYFANTSERLDAVAPRFAYLVSAFTTQLQSLRRLSHVTSMAAVCALFSGLANTFQGVSVNKATGIGAISGGLMESLNWALCGLVISLFIYSIAAIFESTLARRVATWKYNYDCRATD